MKQYSLVVLLSALGACTTPNNAKIPAGRSDTQQVPSNYEPGVHIGGHVNVGVVRTF